MGRSKCGDVCGIAPRQHHAPIAAHPVLAFAEDGELLTQPFWTGVVPDWIGEVEAALVMPKPAGSLTGAGSSDSSVASDFAALSIR